MGGKKQPKELVRLDPYPIDDDDDCCRDDDVAAADSKRIQQGR